MAAVRTELLPQLEMGGWQITAPIERLWAGERSLAVLTAGIDPNSARLIELILGADAPETVARAAAAHRSGREDERAETGRQNARDTYNGNVVFFRRVKQVRRACWSLLQLFLRLHCFFVCSLAVIVQCHPNLSCCAGSVSLIRPAGGPFLSQLADMGSARHTTAVDGSGSAGQRFCAGGPEAERTHVRGSALPEWESRGWELTVPVERLWAQPPSGVPDLATLTAGIDRSSAFLVQLMMEDDGIGPVQSPPRPSIGAQVARAAQMMPPEELAELEELLASGDPDMRRMMMEAAAEMGMPDVGDARRVSDLTTRVMRAAGGATGGARAAGAGSLRSEDHVRGALLAGLNRRPEMNGLSGTIVGFNPTNGRYLVQLDSVERPVAIHPKNAVLPDGTLVRISRGPARGCVGRVEMAGDPYMIAILRGRSPGMIVRQLEQSAEWSATDGPGAELSGRVELADVLVLAVVADGGQ